MKISPPAPNLDFRFCHFYAASGRYHLFARYDVACGCVESPDSAVYLNLQDCTLRGGRINLGNPDYFYLYDDDYVYAPGAVSWTNNTFDNVNINLDPTYYEYGWDDLGLNVNLSFAAYNNRFRGSLWFHLEPIPASAGNWMLQDNLFDKVDIVQDLNIAPINQSLDYDYNGYWPLSASALNWDAYFIPPWGTEEYWGFAYCAIANTSQLQPTTTGDGFTDGGHEVVLTAPPPYQTSFFGNYYLPINTPLYGAGSTTAGVLGLYHYTTRIDQVKEGDEPAGHKVNIGVHYVAASVAQPLGGPLPRTGGSSPVYSLTDSDGDGIPDYVENWHGDGRYDLHTDTETDWQNAMTDGVTNDAYNAIYDDVDLSGDGLTGRAKRILGIDPLSAENPLKLTPVITGDEPFILTYSVSLATDVISSNCVLTLLDNGTPAGHEFYQVSNNIYQVAWNTTFASYGFHMLQVELGMPGSCLPLNDNGMEPVQPVLSVAGPTRIENVNNLIQFDPTSTSFGSQAWIYGVLQVASADYQINIYDATNNLVKTITGHTDSGTLDKVWDLTDTNNQVRADQEFHAQVYVTPTGIDSGALIGSGALIRPLDTSPLFPYPIDLFRSGESGDAFSLAFGWNVLCDLDFRKEMLRLGVVDQVFSPTLDNTYQNTSLNCYDCDPFFMYSKNDQTNLLNDLANGNVGNFFWFGHGEHLSFGAAKNVDSEVNHSSIAIWDLERVLGNKWNLRHTFLSKNHPFRLVIMETCETAQDSQLAEAFGIDGRVHSKNWFERHGQSPQAYVGWSTIIYVPGCPIYNDPFTSHSEHQADLFGLWMSEVPLMQCVAAGATPYTIFGVPVLFDTPLYPTWKIFGDPYLTRTPTSEP